MAKMVKCKFCGKEMKDSFFSSDVFYLSMGEDVSVHCCEDCYKQYGLGSKDEEKRFKAKVANYKKSNGKRKLTDAEQEALYITYYNEMKAYEAKNAGVTLNDLGYFKANEDGFFSIAEFALGSVIFSKEIANAIDKVTDEAIGVFDRTDISCLEYRLTDKLGTDTGKAMTTAYVFEVLLNDPRVMTYKPCVTYVVATGTAFLPHKRKEQAEESVISALNVLKKTTGAMAQIVKIK